MAVVESAVFIRKEFAEAVQSDITTIPRNTVVSTRPAIRRYSNFASAMYVPIGRRNTASDGSLTVQNARRIASLGAT